MNSKHATFAVHEKELTDESYPVRNSDGDVDLLNNLVVTADSSGDNKNYIIREQYPDELLGLIILVLGDYTATP